MATDATAIIAIPEALLETAATRHFEGTLDLAELAAGPDTYTFAAPVSWSVEATNTGDAILIQGTAAGDAATQCARCLEDVTYGLEGDIEGYFLVGGEEEAETPEDMETPEVTMLYSKAAVVNSLMDKIAEKCKTNRPAPKAEPRGRSVDDLYERLNLLKH